MPYRQWPYLCSTRHWEGPTGQRLPNGVDTRQRQVTGCVLYCCGTSQPNIGCYRRHPSQHIGGGAGSSFEAGPCPRFLPACQTVRHAGAPQQLWLICKGCKRLRQCRVHAQLIGRLRLRGPFTTIDPEAMVRISATIDPNYGYVASTATDPEAKARASATNDPEAMMYIFCGCGCTSECIGLTTVRPDYRAPSLSRAQFAELRQKLRRVDQVACSICHRLAASGPLQQQP